MRVKDVDFDRNQILVGWQRIKESTHVPTEEDPLRVLCIVTPAFRVVEFLPAKTR